MKEEVTVAGDGQPFWRSVGSQGLSEGGIAEERDKACPQCPAKVVGKKELRLSDD